MTEAAPAITVICPVWLPTDPPRPAPPLLTEEEAILLLRIDQAGARNPSRTLRYYLDEGRLVGRRIGHRIMFPLSELMRLIDGER